MLSRPSLYIIVPETLSLMRDKIVRSSTAYIAAKYNADLAFGRH